MLKLAIHVALTFATGGLWLVVLIVRALIK